MKIKIAEILPGDALVLADGTPMTAAGTRAVGVEGLIEVLWKDGTTPCTFDHDAEIQVIARLHMVVPSEMEEQETAERIAAHIAWISMGPGKDSAMLDGYACANGTSLTETLNPFADKGHFRVGLQAPLASPDDQANDQ